MTLPTQAPAPAPLPATKRRNTIGLIAMIMSIVGFIFACVPGALIIGWVLLPVSFILGLVALFRKDESRWQGITAIIVAVVGTIVGALVFFGVVSNSIDEALDSGSESSVSTGEAPADVSSTAAAQNGTREDPAPLGSEIANAEWKVVVNSVTLGADEEVLAANMFNEEAPEGYEYILINYSVTYLGSDANGQSPAFVDVSYVSPDGVTIDSADALAVAPDAIDTLTTLYNGGSVTGNVALLVPSASVEEGVLAVQPGLLADKTFVAVQ